MATTIKELVKLGMRQRGWSQAELARKLSQHMGETVDPAVVSRWLNAQPNTPSPRYCAALAAVLAIPEAEVMRAAGHMTAATAAAPAGAGAQVDAALSSSDPQRVLVRQALEATLDEVPREAWGEIVELVRHMGRAISTGIRRPDPHDPVPGNGGRLRSVDPDAAWSTYCEMPVPAVASPAALQAAGARAA